MKLDPNVEGILKLAADTGPEQKILRYAFDRPVRAPREDWEWEKLEPINVSDLSVRDIAKMALDQYKILLDQIEYLNRCIETLDESLRQERKAVAVLIKGLP